MRREVANQSPRWRVAARGRPQRAASPPPHPAAVDV